MKTLLLSFLLLLSNSHCLGQEAVRRHYFQFEVGEMAFLFGDHVNIRQQPDVNSKMIAQLEIGHQMAIINETRSAYTINGMEAPWYLVRFEFKGREIQGYIWGGLLAQYRLISIDSVAFYYGLVHVDERKLTAEMRAVKGKHIVSKVSFQTVGDLDHYTFGWLDNGRGVANIKQLIGAHACFDACDYECGEVLLVWDGQELHYLGNTSISGGGGSSHQGRFLFPDDHGRPEIIIGEDIQSELDVLGNGTEIITKRIYKWDGEKLVNIKEDY